MIEFEMEAQRFLNIVKAVSINGVIETPILQFLPNGIRAVNKDLADAVFNYSSFSKNYFANYKVDEKVGEGTEKGIGVECSFEAEKLLKVVKILSGDMAKVQVNKDNNQIIISTKDQKATVPIIETPLKKDKLPIFTEEKEGVLEVQDTFMISEKIPLLKRETAGLGQEDTIFMVADNILSAKQKTVDGYSFTYNIKNVSGVDFSVIGDTAYLNNIFDSLIGSEVELRLSKEEPIVIIDKTIEYDVVVVLAPKMEQ